MNVVQGHWQVQSQCVHVGQRGEYCMPPCAVVLVALELVLVMGLVLVLLGRMQTRMTPI